MSVWGAVGGCRCFAQSKRWSSLLSPLPEEPIVRWVSGVTDGDGDEMIYTKIEVEKASPTGGCEDPVA